MSMAISGNGGGISPQAMSGASMPMPPSQKMSNLFDQIAGSSSGSISKSQFAQAFQSMNPPKGFQQAGAATVWAKLDPNGTGSVNKQDFITGMTAQMAQLRGHHHHLGDSSSPNVQTPAQTISSSLDGLNAVGSPGAKVNTSA